MSILYNNLFMHDELTFTILLVISTWTIICIRSECKYNYQKEANVNMSVYIYTSVTQLISTSLARCSAHGQGGPPNAETYPYYPYQISNTNELIKDPIPKKERKEGKIVIAASQRGILSWVPNGGQERERESGLQRFIKCNSQFMNEI